MKISFTLLSILIIAFFIQPGRVKAQKLSAESTYEISNKAKRGYLGNINIDEGNNLIELTYVTKANDKRAKFETYQFDLAFNFKNMLTDEVEFDQAKTKFKWFKYKGEDYSINAISVEANLVGTLVLRKKLISYHWNWFWGGYDRTVKLLEKVKPKTEEGNKYQVWAKAENNESGDVIVLASEKFKKGDDPLCALKKFHVLQINTDLDIVKNTAFDFQYPQAKVKVQIIASNSSDNDDDDGDDISTSDLGVLFAPAGMKNGDPNPKNYTFVRIGNNTDIKEKISFQSGMSVWGVNAMITDGGNTFIFGPAKGDDKYYDNVMRGGVDIETMKWDHFQIMKIANGAASFVNAISIDEFEQKLKTPPSQKRAPAYKGKKFAFSSIAFSGSGDIFIMGQNFSLNKDHIRKYEDPLMFHFSKDGALKAQYGVRRDLNNKYAEATPVFQKVIESNDGKGIFWMMGEVKSVREEKELQMSKFRVLMYPTVSKINIDAATIGDFADFGQEKFYLNNAFPFLPLDQKKSIVFFGENKSGKTLWFGKLPLD